MPSRLKPISLLLVHDLAPSLLENVDCRANIAPPMLQFSERKLEWCYSYMPGQAVMPLSQPLVIQNVSPLNITCTLKTTAPFSIDQHSCNLAPDEAITFSVSFDPAQK